MPVVDGVGAAEVTIVVVPREKYRRGRAVLERLLAMEAPPFHLVWVDEGRAPRRLRRWVAAEADRRGFRHLALRDRAGANACRARGVELAVTPYVLLLDNDAFLGEGALAALLDCAHATDASFVAPVCTYRSGAVHHAGGGDRLEESVDGRRLVARRQPTGGLDPAHLERARADGPELHGVLARRSALRAGGGLDPDLFSSMDCTDLGLRLVDRDGGGWVEPRAIVTYDNAWPRPNDLRLYLGRWSRATVEPDLAHFVDQWQLDPADRRVDEHRQHLSTRRRRLVRYPRGALRRTLGGGAVGRFDRAVEAVLDRFSDVRRVER
ncbi:MAG: glycosyltransferase family 2 protein [Acidimicrobiales bacterium]